MLCYICLFLFFIPSFASFKKIALSSVIMIFHLVNSPFFIFSDAPPRSPSYPFCFFFFCFACGGVFLDYGSFEGMVLGLMDGPVLQTKGALLH